jgi:hypothetical protein
MKVITNNPIFYESYSNFNSSNTNEVKAFQIWSNSKGYLPKLTENGSYDFLTKMSYTNHGAEYETSKGKDFAFDVTQPKVVEVIGKPLFTREPTKKPEDRVQDYIKNPKVAPIESQVNVENTKKNNSKTKTILIISASALLLITVLYFSLRKK